MVELGGSGVEWWCIGERLLMEGGGVGRLSWGRLDSAGRLHA